MNDDKLATTLGTAPLKPVQTITVPKSRSGARTSDEQFDEVTENIRTVNEVGEIAMLEIASVAAQTQQPRAYEIVAALMGQLVNSNKTLIELEKMKLEIEEKQNKPSDEVKTINNTMVFHGSTSELLEQLKVIKE